MRDAADQGEEGPVIDVLRLLAQAGGGRLVHRGDIALPAEADEDGEGAVQHGLDLGGVVLLLVDGIGHALGVAQPLLKGVQGGAEEDGGHAVGLGHAARNGAADDGVHVVLHRQLRLLGQTGGGVRVVRGDEVRGEGDVEQLAQAAIVAEHAGRAHDGDGGGRFHGEDLGLLDHHAQLLGGDPDIHHRQVGALAHPLGHQSTGEDDVDALVLGLADQGGDLVIIAAVLQDDRLVHAHHPQQHPHGVPQVLVGEDDRQLCHDLPLLYRVIV